MPEEFVEIFRLGQLMRLVISFVSVLSAPHSNRGTSGDSGDRARTKKEPLALCRGEKERRPA